MAWSRRRPRRAAGRLAWVLAAGSLVCAPVLLIFGDEPWEAANGAVNPLALVAPTVVGLFALLLVPHALALVRRPLVAADHYALTVRPGVLRTLVLPWAQLAELAAVEIDDERFLLVRCLSGTTKLGDRPRWVDQAHLRSVRRVTTAADAYHLAVPMDDFVGRPAELLGQLAAYAPAHVAIVDQTE